jgi:hypothetical protein
MAARLINLDRQTPMFLPCDLREWVPAEHIVHFILDALALEVIFQRPTSELFGGLYRKVQQEVAERAKTLAGRPDRQKSNAQASKRRQILNDLAGKSLNQS